MESIKTILIGIALMIFAIGVYVLSQYFNFKYTDGYFTLFFSIGIIVSIIGAFKKL
ncbi:MAG: hypothetical protein PHF63_04390 [Herbinix sp.]|nr:hypothetical protein [Herbinix sp.]